MLKNSYNRNGFVICKGIISKRLLENIRETLLSLSSKLVPELSKYSDLEDPRFVKSFSDLKKSRPEITGAIYDTMQTANSLLDLVHGKKVVEEASELLATKGTDLSHFFRCLRIDVPGNNPNELDWHQDYMATEKASVGATDGLTVWIPLHRVDAKRGTMQICLGSHLERVADVTVTKRKDKNASEYIQISKKYINKYPKKYIEAEAGDAVFMCMNALHRSVASSVPLIRYTAIGRYFKMSSEQFVYGSQKFVPSKI